MFGSFFKMKSSPVGLYFHSYYPSGQVNCKGKVVRQVGSRYEVQFYDMDDDSPTNKAIVSESELQNFVFYENQKHWSNA